MYSILIVKTDNGEQYEDYIKWVHKVYKILTDKTGLEIEIEWKNHLVYVMSENNIIINPNWLNIMEFSEVKDKKLYKKLLNENKFCAWLEKNYGAVQIDFHEVHPRRDCV